MGMINIKKIYEDAIAAGGDVGGVATGTDTSVTGGSETTSPEISTDDVLGKCDHEHNYGYMKDGCFHLPGKILKTLKRLYIAPKKKAKKKKKNK